LDIFESVILMTSTQEYSSAHVQKKTDSWLWIK